MMRVNYTDWWNDVVAILRANASILVAIAGAFAFLPTLLGSFTATPPPPLGERPSIDELFALYRQLFTDNWVRQVSLAVVNSFGQLLLYLILVDGSRPRVGDAFRMALPLFLPFFLLNVVTSLMLGAATLVFIVPGLYLLGRVLLSAPIMVAERRLNPFAAVGRSFALTKGQGWRIAFFVILLFIVGLVIQFAVGAVLGLAFRFIGDSASPFGIGRLLDSALQALFAAIFFVLSVAVWVALYRRLTADIGKVFT